MGRGLDVDYAAGDGDGYGDADGEWWPGGDEYGVGGGRGGGEWECY